jgi:hypothetical protein
MKFSAPSNFGEMVGDNLTIKIGQVIRANFPKQEEGGQYGFITYDVMTNDKVGASQGNMIYYDCMISQMFGSAADYLEYSLRANVRPKNGEEEGQEEDILTDGQNVEKDAAKKLMGATVLVACVAGQADQAVIIGFLPSTQLKRNKEYKPQDEKLGKFLKFNFNGINVDVNNDGELFLQRRGPTDPAGAISDEETANSFVKINKAGEILISTTAKEDAQEASNDDIDNLILIDKKGNITIKIDGGKGISLKNKDSNAEFTLGDGAKHVAIAEELQNLYTELKAQLELFANHTHQGTAGPFPVTTTPGVPPLQVPSWNSAIASQRMKVPK